MLRITVIVESTALTATMNMTGFFTCTRGLNFRSASMTARWNNFPSNKLCFFNELRRYTALPESMRKCSIIGLE